MVTKDFEPFSLSKTALSNRKIIWPAVSPNRRLSIFTISRAEVRDYVERIASHGRFVARRAKATTGSIAPTPFSEDRVQREKTGDYFSSSKYTGPLTLNVE